MAYLHALVGRADRSALHIHVCVGTVNSFGTGRSVYVRVCISRGKVDFVIESMRYSLPVKICAQGAQCKATSCPRSDVMPPPNR